MVQQACRGISQKCARVILRGNERVLFRCEFNLWGSDEMENSISGIKNTRGFVAEKSQILFIWSSSSNEAVSLYHLFTFILTVTKSCKSCSAKKYCGLFYQDFSPLCRKHLVQLGCVFCVSSHWMCNKSLKSGRFVFGTCTEILSFYIIDFAELKFKV